MEEVLSHNRLKNETVFADHAKALYSSGFLPVPLESNNPKKPAIRYKDIALKGMTTRQLDRLVNQFPNANIATVVPNGMVCADFDAEMPKGLHLPASATAIARRGEHRWYTTAQPLTTTKLVIGAAVYGDIKGAGSIVVMPASKIRGHGYEWGEGLSPAEVGMAVAPNWLHTEKLTEEKQEQISMSCFSSVSFAVSGSVAAFFCSSALPRLLNFLDISAPLGTSFSCVLPGHREESPSASVSMRNGWPVYTDWHARAGKRKWFSLAEVFASQRRGVVTPLTATDDDWSGLVHLLWSVRLLLESGVLRVPRPAIPLPEDAPACAKAVAEGFSLLLACRWLLSPGEPAPFSYRFGKLWCGLTETSIADGLSFLRESKLLRIVGATRIGGRETLLYSL